MIRIFLGNVGSGKTISIIKEMVDNIENENYLHTYSNIITKSKGKYAIKKNHLFSRNMWIKKEIIKTQRSEKVKLTFNKEAWEKVKQKYKSFNIVIDEAHTLMNARQSMSKKNVIINEGIALIRKICTNPNTDATLTLISQLDNRIDLISREMATEVRYHISLYDKICSNCKAYWTEHSEMSDFKKHKICPNCNGYNIKKFNHRIIIHFFNNIRKYQDWKYNNMNTIAQTSQILNVEKYFNYYDTFQLDDLFSVED